MPHPTDLELEQPGFRSTLGEPGSIILQIMTMLANVNGIKVMIDAEKECEI